MCSCGRADDEPESERQPPLKRARRAEYEPHQQLPAPGERSGAEAEEGALAPGVCQVDHVPSVAASEAASGPDATAAAVGSCSMPPEHSTTRSEPPAPGAPDREGAGGEGAAVAAGTEQAAVAAGRVLTLDDLPDEIIIEIVKRLDRLGSLRGFGRVSRRYRAAVRDPRIWEEIFIGIGDQAAVNVGGLLALLAAVSTRLRCFTCRCPRLLDSGVAPLAIRASTLTSLDLGGCSALTPAVLTELAPCASLAVLTLDRCFRPPPGGHALIPDEHAAALCGMPRLACLDTGYGALSPAALARLAAAAPLLRKLHTALDAESPAAAPRHVAGVSAAVAQCGALEDLRLSSAGDPLLAPESALDPLAALARLRSLRLDGIAVSGCPDDAVRLAFLRPLARLRRLYLALWSSQTLHSAGPLEGMTDLEHLVLVAYSYTPEAEEELLRVLAARAPRLRALVLSLTHSARLLRSAPQMVSLVHLQLVVAASVFEEEDVPGVLAACPALACVTILLDRPPANAARLAALPKLRELKLHETSGAGWGPLAAEMEAALPGARLALRSAGEAAGPEAPAGAAAPAPHAHEHP